MADADSSGPTKATIALITILGLPVILVLLFLVVGRVQSGQSSALPDVRTKGLKWAQARSDDAGFTNVSTHDALGRNRGSRDAKAWMVCFQVPAAGNHARKTEVALGVVRVTEKCPTTDQGRIEPAGAIMPSLVGRTAYMATVSLGDDASVRYIDVASQREITRDLGDYRVCAQDPLAGQPFDGVPVKAAVVPYGERCDAPRGAPKSVDPAALLSRVLNSLPG